MPTPATSAPLTDTQALLLVAPEGYNWQTWLPSEGVIEDPRNIALYCRRAGAQPGTGALITKTGVSAGAAAGGAVAGSAIVGAETAGTIGVVGASLATAGVTAGLGLIVAGILAISSHHAAAVKKENAFLCQFLPQVNSSVAQIDAAFASGQITASQADDLFDKLYNAAQTALAPITKECNAACIMPKRIRALQYYRVSGYRASVPPGALSSAGGIGKTAIAGAAVVAGVRFL